MRCTCHFRKLL